MQIIEIQPTNSYSCQFCQKEIVSDKELEIIENEKPYCSNSCLFKFCYALALSSFPNKDNVYLFHWTRQFVGVLKCS